jgi:UDP-N-acetylmuramoyl-tripeptide--D-alanyl-D-alanine ligase
VPLTVFKLEPEHEVLIQEMAMRLPGEIGHLAQIVRPDVGVITNIGLSHIERLGNQDSIAAAKAELIEELKADGIAVLNADDPYFEYLSSKVSGEMVSFGISAGDVQAKDIRIDDQGRPSFIIVVGTEEFKVSLPVVGEHYVSSVLAATAVGLCFGMSVKDIAAGIEGFSALDKRANVYPSAGGWTIFDDTYNASPASVRSALRTLASMKGERKVAVLGDMKELGDYSVPTHREIGQLTSELGISLLITVGSLGKEIARGAVEWGFKNTIKEFETSEEAAGAIRADIKPGDVVLVKGSRAMKMESVVEVLK